jgi:hypothetical protein
VLASNPILRRDRCSSILGGRRKVSKVVSVGRLQHRRPPDLPSAGARGTRPAVDLAGAWRQHAVRAGAREGIKIHPRGPAQVRFGFSVRRASGLQALRRTTTLPIFEKFFLGANTACAASTSARLARAKLRSRAS